MTSTTLQCSNGMQIIGLTSRQNPANRWSNVCDYPQVFLKILSNDGFTTLHLSYEGVNGVY